MVGKNSFPECDFEVVEVDGAKSIKAKCADLKAALELKELLNETVTITVEVKAVPEVTSKVQAEETEAEAEDGEAESVNKSLVFPLPN